MARRGEVTLEETLNNRGEHIGTGTDKLGREIHVFWQKNTEPENRGFVCDMATAWTGDDSECLGFVRTAYVKQENYDRLNPTIWNHANNFSGQSFGLHDGNDPRDYPQDSEEAKKFRAYALHRFGFRNHPDPGSYEEFENIIKKSGEYRRLVQQREDFFTFHLERPYVDYSDVKPRTIGVFIENDSSGMGVGKILYAATAHAVEAMGMRFRSSGLQSDGAKGIWKRFEKLGYTDEEILYEGTDREKKRLILCADRMPEDIFRHDRPDDSLSP